MQTELAHGIEIDPIDDYALYELHVKTLTEPLARLWLARARKNRTVSLSEVDRLYHIMESGQWRPRNGETIKFDKQGYRLDGETRLRAFLKGCDEGTLTTIQISVITGIETSDQDSMDNGRKRTVANALDMRNEVSTRVLAAACRYLVALLDYPYTVMGGGNLLSVDDTLEILRQHPNIRNSIAAARPVGQYIQASPATALHYLFSSVNADAADTFFQRLATGIGLQAGSPILMLRNRLTDRQRVGFTMTPRMQMALTIKAWNAYLIGKDIQQLKWTEGGPKAHPFPRIEGLTLQAMNK